jgi:hypothetical protein
MLRYPEMSRILIFEIFRNNCIWRIWVRRTGGFPYSEFIQFKNPRKECKRKNVKIKVKN